MDGEVDHAVGDHDVDAGVGERDVLEVALQELDVRDTGVDRVAPGQVQHLGRHVEADRQPAGPDPAGTDQDIGPGTGPEVQDDLAGVQVGHGGRDTASQRGRDRGVRSPLGGLGVVEVTAAHDLPLLVRGGHRRGPAAGHLPMGATAPARRRRCRRAEAV